MSDTSLSRERIYVDLEYCFPGMTREMGRPDESQKRQVVQIAAIRVNILTGAEVASLDLLTFPALEKALPPFFVELTAISDQMLQERGILFSEAFQEFKNFCGDTPIWTFWGDWGVLQQNCAYFNIPFTFQPFTRVKELLPDWGVDPLQYSSGTLYQAAGLRMDGHVHNALHDVRSMAAAVHYFTSRTSL